MNSADGTIERELFIAAKPETIFAFLVDAEKIATWLGVLQQLDARPDGAFAVELTQGHIASGRYTEVVPFRRVAFTWGWQSHDTALAALRPGTSLVEFELEPKDGGTLLRLRHSRLPRDLHATHIDRWAFYLGRLKSSVEGRGDVRLW